MRAQRTGAPMGGRGAILLLASACCTLMHVVTAGGAEADPVADALTPGIFLEEPEERALPSGVPPRRVADKGVALVKAFEGFRGRLYNDAAGYCSIGYGHLIKKSPCDGTEPAEFLGGLNEQASEQLLRRDLGIAEAAATALIGATLNDGQYGAVVSFIYNVGAGNLRRSSLLHVINNGPDAYNEVRWQLRRWVKAGGRTWPGLQRRREREADLFFEDVGEPRAAAAPIALIDIRIGELR